MIRTAVSTAIAALLLCAASAAASAAQSTPIDHLPALKGDYFLLRSKAVEHPYHIHVRLPEGYESEPRRRYPVVYLLDGDSLFPILAAQHLFLTLDDKLPEAIVVGIAYGSFAKPANRRHIDFMPPAPGAPAGQSGAEAFHAFLKTELIPRVERQYRVDPARRILFGQSLGGTMVLYSAFADPDLFWGRIASNPWLEPGQPIFNGPPPDARRDDLRLVVASGTADRPQGRKGALDWFNSWERRDDAPWALKGIDIQGGTHAANSPDAYRAAMRWLFAEQMRAR